jgi:amino acid transporter
VNKSSVDATRPAGRLGTFAGVFTPSVLTILGIILFLRLGYVMGSAGLARGLVIIALANVISVLTSISLSAMATNLKVRGGGDYYLISRTLGLEFGGSIGLVLFLAQSVSIAFYCIGFAEAVAAFFLWCIHLTVQLIAAGAVAFLFIFAWQGADWATRFQFGRHGPADCRTALFFHRRYPRLGFGACWLPTGRPRKMAFPFGFSLPSFSPPSPGLPRA